jgi:hypothetical protein
MFFKLTARNPYRDLVRNARRIVLSDQNEQTKAAAFAELYAVMKPRLAENERLLNSQAAFAQRCAHWNQVDISSIKPVCNLKNPWLRFKREFEQVINASSTANEAVKTVSIALAWFYTSEHKDDWIVD